MKNNKGFTLVELLAVIVIMGILMMVAIPSVTRTIENSRKDTFVDIAKSYGNAARTLWTSDNLTCNGVVSSAVDDGDYYILINSKEGAKERLPVLVDQGGKSSWGNRDVNGYVRVNISTTSGEDTNGDGVYEVEPRRVTKFYVALSDGTHGLIDDNTLMMDELKRGNVVMSLSQEDLKKIEFTLDDGKLNCALDATGRYSCMNVTPIKNMTGVCVDDNTNVALAGSGGGSGTIRYGSKYIRTYLRSASDADSLPSEITLSDDGSAVAIQAGSTYNYPAGTFQIDGNRIVVSGIPGELSISNDGTKVLLKQGSTLIAQWTLEGVDGIVPPVMFKNVRYLNKKIIDGDTDPGLNYAVFTDSVFKTLFIGDNTNNIGPITVWYNGQNVYIVGDDGTESDILLGRFSDDGYTFQLFNFFVGSEDVAETFIYVP